MSEIIKTIEIEIAGVTVKVTPQQAKDLHSALAELLNMQSVKIVERQIVRENPYPYPFWQWNPNTLTTIGTTFKPTDKYTISYAAKESSANVNIL